MPLMKRPGTIETEQVKLRRMLREIEEDTSLRDRRGLQEEKIRGALEALDWVMSPRTSPVSAVEARWRAALKRTRGMEDG